MTAETTVYLSGLLSTLAISLIVIAYLKRSMYPLLTELCGNRERAAFWQSISNLAITITAQVFAMSRTPDLRSETALISFVSQLKWGFIAMLFVLFVITVTLAGFIREHPRTPASSTN